MPFNPATVVVATTGAFALLGAGLTALATRRLQHWFNVGQALESLGISRDELQFAGSVRGHAVEVARATGKGPRAVVVRVQLRPQPDHLRFSPADASSSGAAAIVVGDPDFDAVVRVHGPEVLVRSRLHRDVRERLLSVLAQRAAFDGSAFEWRLPGRPPPDRVRASVDLLLFLADRLCEPVLADRLADTARMDLPRVAIGALRALPLGPAQRAVDAIMLQTVRDERAIIAALREGSGRERDRLHKWACESTDDDFRSLALRALSRLGDATVTARRCLDTPKVATIALQLLADADPPVPLAVLAQLVQAHVAAPTALWVARRYGRSAEPLHISCLQHPEPATQHAAAEGLQFLGTQAAVKPLRAFMQRVRHDQTRLDAARGALDTILTRHNAVAGHLSMLDDSGTGGLSEA